jgi:23S rRNA (guanosine2251-2'-O)-methyltransferase
MSRSSNAQHIYGRHPVEELLRSRPDSVRCVMMTHGDRRMESTVSLANRAGVRVHTTSRRDIEKLVGQVAHQGLVAVVDAFEYTELEDLVPQDANVVPLIVALDGVTDPHNLGALVRSAYALGAHGLFFAKDRACEVNATAVKASAGATAHLPIARVTNITRALEILKERGLWVVGTTPDAPQPLQSLDLRGPTVIVVGSEGDGMRPLVTRTCDHLVHIPMPGDLGSLNASVAGAICLYEVSRQRR